MLRIYKKKSILIAIIIGLFFTFNTFAQKSTERAKRIKEQGDGFAKSENYKKAIDTYLKAIDEDKNYADTYWGMAFSLSKMHEHKLAGLAYITYLEKVDNGAPAYIMFLIGNEYRLAKEFELSDKAFDIAVKTAPQYFEDYEALSNIHRYRGNLAKAVQYQKAAINFSNTDNDVAGYVGLSWYYSFLQQNQNAADAATKAIQLDPKEAMAYTNRCRAYNDLKQYDKALIDCRKAISMRPNHGESQYYMANAYRGKGNTKEATRLNKLSIPNLFKELQEAAKTETISLPDYTYILGNAYFEDGNFTKAAEAYEIGLEFRPNFPNIRFNLGVAYLRIGDKEGAMQQYRELLKIDNTKAVDLKKRINAAK